MDKDCINKNIDEFNKKMAELEDKATEKFKEMKKELDKTREKAEWYVRYNPKKSVAISVGAGIIIGMVLLATLQKRRS